ncbi:rabphilin-3A-like [Argiope bruennichi]|uniref:rabphilin-3A-like n=1 Tax=Argiope bruennichi TaxID=94029 RepID=UPI00249564A9|nr:rabphilin-3A-like [Argiope bruennichi]XP_055943959.1 rabphilin-3A-like [Argiope bruennichi]
MGDFGAVRDKWVCPNDRELSLRAKLKTGWSVKTNSINSFNKPEQLNDTEQEIIMSVIRRAETLDKVEQERIGRLVERLENMKKNAMGNGASQCVLCADEFGILGASPLVCNDCKKAVCTKCGVDTLSAHKEPICLCKICAETRETWKKSGAWFYKGLPKYILPGKKSEPSKYSTTASPSKSADVTTQRTYNSWLQSKGKSASEKENTDSSDDELKSSRLAKRATVKKSYGDSVDNNDSTGVMTPPADSAQGPSPTHLYSPAMPDSPRSPQHRDDFNRSPGHEGYSPYSKQEKKVGEGERSQTPTATSSHWYKPSTKREAADQEDYSERQFRGHNRKESQHSPVSRYRPVTSSSRMEEMYEDKPVSPEESSTLEFSLLFDAHNQVLHCTVYRAKGLRPTDINGLADPFVRLQLLPVQSKMDKLRTRTVHKTLNPEFNEALSFYGISDYDIAKRTLKMTVMDEDTHCNEPMGEIRIALKRLKPQQPSYANVYLEKPRPDDTEEENSRGQILLALLYSDEHNALVVNIVRCVRLPSRENNGFPDPFVKVQLKPDAMRRRFKTSTKKKTLNPEYNEQYAFEMEPGELTKKTIEVTVWDKDCAKQDVYIGGLALNMQSKGDRLRHWLDIAQNSNRRIERWHPLSNVVFID